jgi:hypothetical protein
MADSEWVSDVLTEEWDSSEDPLEEGDQVRDPVPKPDIIAEGARGERASDVRNDTIFVGDGGDPVVEPASVGYRDEYIESKISGEAVVTGSRREFVGTPAMTYGGVAGEMKRIFDLYRKGVPDDSPISDPGYDILKYEVFSDDTAKRGAGLWSGEWTVVFVSFASSIAQPAGRR